MSATLPSNASKKTLTPEVTWAQRSSDSDSSKNFIYLSILAPDVPKSSLKLDLQPTSVSFSGHSESKKVDYEVKLELFSEIDPSASKVNHSSRVCEIKLQKKELKTEYWPRLLKDKAKQHFLKTDFDKWVDEDEQDAAADDDLGGFDGAGMDPSMMGGMGGSGMGGLDFSKLGGMGGGPGGFDMSQLQGMMGGQGAGEDDEDDDEMPDLEDEEDEAGEGSSKAAAGGKIEEVE